MLSCSAQKSTCYMHWLHWACPYGEDTWKQHTDITRTYKSSKRLQNTWIKAPFTTTQLFTWIFAKETLLLASQYFELPTIHEKAATSSLPIVSLHTLWPQVSFTCESYVEADATVEVLIVWVRGLPCALSGVVSYAWTSHHSWEGGNF